MTLLGTRWERMTRDARVDSSVVRWMLLCSAISVSLRLPFFTVPLGVDEGGDSYIAREWGTTEGSMYGASWLDRSPLLVLLYKIGVLGGDRGVRLLGMVAAVLLVVGTMAIAHRLSGARAARLTGVITAIMTSSLLLGAVFTVNELLAAVPVTYSILALVWARDSTRSGPWLFASGLMASCGALIKESFLEALAAGVVFLVVSRVMRDRTDFRATWVGWWSAGVAVPILLVMAWFEVFANGARSFAYAMIGFRLDTLTAQAESPLSPSYMLVHLGLPVLVGSGCLLLAPWAVSWLLEHRADPQLMLPLAAWLVVGFLGITGGGHYYPHYFIQPLAALAVLAGAALSASSRRVLAGVTAAALVLLALGNLVIGDRLKTTDPPQEQTLAVASYLRANAHPDDTLYVMYARANLLYYARMPTPYPYAWSMMVRTVPSAEEQLRAVLKSSTARPTWIVEWHTSSEFGLDRSGETRRLIASHYVLADTVCGKSILIRDDQAQRKLGRDADLVCAVAVPSNPGPAAQWIPRDRARYLWQ